jgi:hypothetical protein
VNRLDLLGAYSMIEPLFVRDDGAHVVPTPTGQRHAGLVQQYVALIDRMAQPLYEDCPQFRPVSGTYSPYGVMFGFSSNILEHMTFKTLQPDAQMRFTLEDAFADEGHGAQRLDWVSGWRRLPHVPQEVLKLYEYPQQFAEEIFGRIEQALRSRASVAAGEQFRTGRLFVESADIAALPLQYVLSSDPEIIAAGKAQSCEPARLQGDRREGMYLVSYQTSGGWVSISKDLLTDLLGAGRDVKIECLPVGAVQTLELMYPVLIAAKHAGG